MALFYICTTIHNYKNTLCHIDNITSSVLSTEMASCEQRRKLIKFYFKTSRLYVINANLKRRNSPGPGFEPGSPVLEFMTY